MKGLNKILSQTLKHRTMKKLTLLLLCIIAVIITGCPNPATCSKGELRFENPPFVLGTTYSSPGSLYNNGMGLTASLNKITLASGLQGFNHSNILNNPPHPFGTNQVIRMNNTVLSFDLAQNTQKVEFEYLDQGGTINLGAKGTAHLYIGNMYIMPASMVINGVSITKSGVSDILNPQGVKVAEKGLITLKYNADIGSMIIGGQELFLDNFCFN